jgi:hypothetical protein
MAAACFATAAAALSLADVPARAQDTGGEADACFTAAERAQPLMKAQRLREARAELEMCARDVCPRVARTDCRGWLADVAARQPSIVISAQEVNPSGDGRDLTGVRAIIDGGIVLERVDATPVPLDPGKHRVHVERAGLSPIEQNIELRDGEKSRVVRFSWQTNWVATKKKTEPPRVHAIPSTFYVLGGLGLAALGVGAYFEATGLSKRSGLAGCKANMSCTQQQVDDAHNSTLYGDIGIGVGIAMLAGATIVYVTRPAEPSPAPSREDVGLSVGPIPGGFMAGVHGSL